MWQRFTECARKVVFYAQEEAQKFGEGYVATEHLLLGLTRMPDCSAAIILDRLGVSLLRVRAEVEGQLPRGDARPSQDMTLTPRAKRVIDLAYDESRELGHDYMGTEHILLGLVREGDGLAGRVLAKLGVELKRTREVAIMVENENPQASSSLPVSGSSLKGGLLSSLSRLIRRLERNETAEALGSAITTLRQGISPIDHFCAIALAETDGAAQKVLISLGFKPMAVLHAIEDELLKPIDIAAVDRNLLSVTDVLAAATDAAAKCGQALNGAHFVLVATTAGNNATSTILEVLGIGLEEMRNGIADVG